MTENMKQFNGTAILVAMLRELDPKTRLEFSEKLAKVSPILARLAERCGFIYADIFLLEDKSLQNLLGRVSEADWSLAWKLSNERIKDCLLKNMSERRQESFLDAMSSAPKVHKRQVYRVQAQIAQLCLQSLEIGEYKMRSRRIGSGGYTSAKKSEKK